MLAVLVTSGAQGTTLAGGFTALDWAVVLGLLLFTTWVGHRKSGKPQDLRGFFLGGRQLPWLVVAASIVATEISAVTFVSFPSVVWREGGNLTYLQIGLFGSLIARGIVGFVLMPAYFEREIYSPYDYVGRRLGEGARRVTSVLFTIGGVLGQSARVYLTAVVLEVILRDELLAVGGLLGVSPLTAAVMAIGVVAVLWTWMGGIAAVVWTDAILFLMFLGGAAATLAVLHSTLDGGLWPAFQAGYEAGKLQLIDTSTDLSKPYTLWIALFVASWGQVGPYGCDQLMVQRLLGCKDASAARKAILASIAAVGVIFLIALVGVGLWAWTEQVPLQGEAARLVADKPDRIFPVFLREGLPAGVRGFVLAGIFAAAISSLDSILAALSQTTLALLPKRADEDERKTLRRSRLLVGFYGVLLCATAVGTAEVAEHYSSILDLALAMAGYTGGALLAAVVLALLSSGRGGAGFLISAPLSVLSVICVAWHEPWTELALGLVTVLLAWAVLWRGVRGDLSRQRCAGQLALLVGCARALLQVLGGGSLPWPWFIPIGTLVAWFGAYGFDVPKAKAAPLAPSPGA